MRVALVQLKANDKLWSLEGLAALLRRPTDVDLIVFPECMPFDEHTPILHAEQQLAEISKGTPDVAFIAGGYVLEGKILRNAVFLCQKGKVLDRHFKRLPWQEPGIAPGGETRLFKWDGGCCIPLICADACDNPSPTGKRMMYEAILKGAGPDVPIVVASYGAWLFDEYWHKPLKAWASGCNAPVLIAAVSGKGESFGGGDDEFYGGGGSGIFRPAVEPMQRKLRGIYVVDTDAGTIVTIRILRSPPQHD